MIRRILVVDDEPDMLRLLARILKGHTPHQVETTINPLEVPQLLTQRAFDVIVTDLRMPGMDGLDILRLVNEHQRGEKTIVITAFASLETALEAMALGAVGYLVKPFKKESILATVAEALHHRELDRQCAQLSGVFGLEPFSKAQEAFQREYVRLLAERLDGDVAEIVRKSGLPAEIVGTILER